MRINNEDKVLLDLLQQDFPLSTRPFQDLADRLNTTEEKLLEKVEEFKTREVIRRIGGVIDAKKMGYYSTLCACQVEQADIDRVGHIINQIKGVTHNYVRGHRYNLWFTLTAPSRDEADRILRGLEKELGITVYAMPALKVYKIRAAFKMGE